MIKSSTKLKAENQRQEKEYGWWAAEASLMKEYRSAGQRSWERYSSWEPFDAGEDHSVWFHYPDLLHYVVRWPTVSS